MKGFRGAQEEAERDGGRKPGKVNRRAANPLCVFFFDHNVFLRVTLAVAGWPGGTCALMVKVGPRGLLSLARTLRPCVLDRTTRRCPLPQSAAAREQL